MRLHFRIVIFLGLLGLVSGCSRNDGEVILYTSQDQVFVEPLLKKFEIQSGLKVRAVFDNESVKTVSLMNRLIAERRNPQCDLFWNNEEFRTRQLASEGLADPARPIMTFGVRTRRIVYHDPLPAGLELPPDLRALTNKMYFGKLAIAYPAYGTTGAHFLALRQKWGAAAWREWCGALKANKPMIVDGNSTVVRLAASGEIALGLTDSDDIASAQAEGQPVKALPAGPDSLRMPNSLAHVAGARHAANAEKLAAFLQSPETLAALQAAHALETEREGTTTDGFKPDYTGMLSELKPATEELLQMFKR